MRTLGQLKMEAARRPLETAYWHDRFSGDWRRSAFTPDITPPDPARAHADDGVPLDPATAEALDRISRGDDLALFTALAAGVAVLLHLHTGDELVTIGQPLMSDPARAEEPLTRTLPLSCVVEGTVREVMLRMRAAVQDAHRHRDYPLDILADHLGLRRTDSPFFDVAVRMEGLHEERSSADLGVGVLFTFHRPGPGRISVGLDYDGSRFSDWLATQIAGRLSLVVAQMVADPGRPVRELSLRSAEDEPWLAKMAGGPEVSFDQDVRVHELFERTAAARPDAVAVVTDTGRHTYAELDRRTDRLARTLRARGVGPDGPVVGVLAERSFELIVAVLAVLKAGGAYLPIDPGYPRARIDYLLSDSGTSVVLADTRWLDLLPGHITAPDLRAEDSYATGAEPPPPHGSARDLMYVIYTSGSTGAPKGVAVEHRSVVNRLGWMQRAYPIAPGDMILQKTPTSFDVSVWELFWWMIEGASVCMLRPGGERDPDAIVSAVERAGVTTMHFVPTMLAAFLDFVAATGAAPRLAGLRQVFASGEALPPHLVRRFHEVLGGPDGTRLINLYGPTEATVDVSHHPCDERDPLLVPIGRPIDNTRLYVVDHRMRPLPPGVPGELCIAGAGLARGYLNRPELTAERFVADPFPGERRVYRTGDLARWLRDGTIEYLGRMDHQVKIRGFRIEPGEIEAAMRAHPGVTDAVVALHDGPGGQPALAGYAVAGAEVTEADLTGHLRRTLPDHMVPARIVLLEAMPLTPGGKLDRSALPKPAEHGPDGRPAQGPTEELLAGIWCQVLGRDAVAADDHFFALGGDSIHFVVVLAKARAAGLDFTFQEFFRHPTIAGLAAHLDAREPAAGSPDPRTAPFELVGAEDRARLPQDAEDAYPLSMLQAGLIFQSEIMRGTAQYHDIISYLISSPFDAALFTEAVRELVRRNPIMRTTYHLTGYSEYLQVVHRDVAPPLRVTDLRELDPAAQQRWYERWLVEEKERRFDWEEPGTLIALYVQVLRDDLYRYNISLHNSTLDGWSINLVHAEVFDIYYRLRAGRELPPHRDDNHLRDYLGLERRSLAAPEEGAFWAGVLDGAPRTAVPALMPPGAPFSVVIAHFDVPLDLSHRVLGLAASLSVPGKDVLLAAHMRVLAVLSGEDDVMTGYEHSGRPEVEGGDRSMGLFLNTVPFRVRQVAATWAELVRQVYETEIDLLPHRRYPMARMKQDLGTQEPLFETTFNFTHFYLLKELKRLPEFDLLDVQVQAETEFVMRAEFSRHFFHDNVRLSLHYHADALSAEQAGRIGGYYVRALELMTRDPHAGYTAQSLLAEEETALVTGRYAADPRSVAASGGDAAAGDRVYVLDGYLQPAPVGTPGDIVLSRPVTGPDGTGRPDPFRPGHVLAPTGRRGRWTASGELAAAEEAEAVEAALPAGEEVAVPPRTDAERRVAEAWSRVLDIPVEEIGAHDGFFELGGNSLAAMRVVMALHGQVSLVDVMRHPRLDELARRIDTAGGPAAEGLLRLLRPGPDGSPGADGTLVCFPYAAGHATAFLDLAGELAGRRPGLAVYGVEPPGHDPTHPDQRLEDTRDTARMVLDELEDRLDGPITLWGHCGGAALTVETARLLEERGADLRQVFIGAKLLNTADALREAIDTVRAMTDRDVVDWLVEATGFTADDGLDTAQAALIGRLFRHDAVCGHDYFLRVREEPGRVRLAVPVTFVGAKDDQVIARYPDTYREWEHIAAEVRLRELDSGGHYFARTRAAAVAALLDDA